MEATILTGAQIDRFRAKVLLSALKLEMLGMKRNGASAYSIIRKDYGLKGSKKAVAQQLTDLLAT